MTSHTDLEKVTTVGEHGKGQHLSSCIINIQTQTSIYMMTSRYHGLPLLMDNYTTK